MIVDNSLITNDFLDWSRLTLRTIEFRLTDAAGNDTPFHGSYCSFSIIFDQMNKKTPDKFIYLSIYNL